MFTQTRCMPSSLKKVNIGVNYISKSFHLQDKGVNSIIKPLYPNPPCGKIGGKISKGKGNRYMVTVLKKFPTSKYEAGNRFNSYSLYRRLKFNMIYQ